MQKRATIHDVAERAGVSKSLVALVFRQESGVSEARRKRVLEAAEELGYAPNAWARTMRSGSGRFIGIIVSEFHNPLFTEMAEAVRQILADRGIFSFVSTATTIDTDEGKELDPAPIQRLVDLKPDALFLVGDLSDLTPFKNLPVDKHLVLALSTSANLPGAVAVRTDDEAGMSLLCAHLASIRHKLVGYIGPVGPTIAGLRRNAFFRSAARYKFETPFGSTGTAVDEQSGFAAAVEMLSETPRPTAVVCHNDNIAFGVQEAIDKLGLTGEVAVAGYDNTYIAKLARISLTSLDQNEDVMASRVCDLLTDKALFESHRNKDILVTPSLHVRESSVPVGAVAAAKRAILRGR
jgi:DNA-binding LacI/PurR family transcriptional regulator